MPTRRARVLPPGAGVVRRPVGLLLAALIAVFALIAPSHAADDSHTAPHGHLQSSSTETSDEPAAQSHEAAQQPHRSGAHAEAAAVPHFEAAGTSCGPGPNYAATAPAGQAQVPTFESRSIDQHPGCLGQTPGSVRDVADAPRSSAGTERLIRDCICRR